MNPAIVLDGVTRRFGDLTAVDKLSLEVYPGEIFGCLGHNGAGKTTTVRLMNGLLEAHSGSMRVLGYDPGRDGPALRAGTGVLTESASLDTRLSAFDNLSIYADMFNVPRSEVNLRVQELLEYFNLADRAGEKVAAFSTGMRQRLALARALLHRPEILFLDEPTSGLDPVAARQVHGMIASLSRDENRTVFLCTHNLVEAQRICDRVAVLENGRLVALGTPAELASKYVQRLDLEIETDPGQIQEAIRVIQQDAAGLATGLPERRNGGFVVTVAGRQDIPDLLALLVERKIRVYSLSTHEPSLEDVYFALHGDKEVLL